MRFDKGIRKGMIVTTSLAVTLCGLPLVGCGGSGAQAAATTEAATEAASTEAATTEQASAEPISVNVGETFTIPDMFEVTIDSFEWLDEVSICDGFITMGTQREGATYFVVRASVKNTGNVAESVGSDDANYLSGRFEINGKYEIDADMVVELENGNSFEVDPLMTSNVIIYGAVSNEIKDQFEYCDLYLTTNEPDADGVWQFPSENLNEDAYVVRLQ